MLGNQTRLVEACRLPQPSCDNNTFPLDHNGSSLGWELPWERDVSQSVGGGNIDLCKSFAKCEPRYSASRRA